MVHAGDVLVFTELTVFWSSDFYNVNEGIIEQLESSTPAPRSIKTNASKDKINIVIELITCPLGESFVRGFWKCPDSAE